jgi:hypothetical protein
MVSRESGSTRTLSLQRKRDIAYISRFLILYVHTSTCRLSCLTNCLLFGFTSEQMRQYFPQLYVEDAKGDAHIVHDKGWLAVLVMFGVERILILIGIMLQIIIDPVSETLSIKIQRRRFLIVKEEKKVR